jgi:hypothetical protein
LLFFTCSFFLLVVLKGRMISILGLPWVDI